MSSHLRMTETEREYVSEIVESSMRVVNRHQFFVWTQGAIQRLVPHEILLCGVDVGSVNGFEQFHFTSSRYFRETHFEAVCGRESGVMRHLRQIAERTQNMVVLCPQVGFEKEEVGLRKLIDENELRNLAACLWMGPRNSPQAYYSFSRIAEPLDERLAYFVELIIPYVHVTFLRVLSKELRTGSRTNSRHGQLVTRRQAEILSLIREGKTNTEIANILAVSPWTVKNHIQMIFQRLNTSNRTQTITRAISLGLLHPE